MRARWLGLMLILGLTSGMLDAETLEIPKPLRDAITPHGLGVQTTDAGQLCLAYDEFLDTILLNVQVGGGPATFFLINARQRGLGIYQATGAGTMVPNSVDATKAEFPWQMSTSLGNNTTFGANGNPNCVLNWLFQGGDNFLEGPAVLTCTGEFPAFTSHGTLHWVPGCLGTEAEVRVFGDNRPLQLGEE